MPKIQDIYFQFLGKFKEKLRWREGVTERIGRRGMKPRREQARDRCPLAPTASVCRHEGELLRTSQTKRENKCNLEIS